MVVRVVCDSNVFDAAAADPGLKTLIEDAQAAGRVVCNIVSIQEDELSRIPAQRDIGQAGAIRAESIPSAVFVLGYSKLDQDRLGGPEANQAFSAIKKGSAKHIEDAMIGATAVLDADILVTNDRRFQRRVAKLGTSIQVLSAVEFGEHLRKLMSAPGS